MAEARVLRCSQSSTEMVQFIARQQGSKPQVMNEVLAGHWPVDVQLESIGELADLHNLVFRHSKVDVRFFCTVLL